MNKYILLCMLLFTNIIYSQNSKKNTISWRYGNTPSLKLTEQHGLIEKNGGLSIAPNSTNNILRTEDIHLEKQYSYTDIFVIFSKISYNSYVHVAVVNAFTDEVIEEYLFHNSGSIPHNVSKKRYNRMYFRITLYGSDIVIRTIGINYQKIKIIDDSSWKLSHQKLYKNKDILTLDLTLNEEAHINLYVYDHIGNITDIILDKTLDAGTYKFLWDPKILPPIDNGSFFYIWLKAENLRSAPVEYTRKIYIIP